MSHLRLAAMLALVLTATGCKRQISSKKVHELIVSMFSEKGITGIRPACPDGLDVKKDAKFQCTALDGTGQTLTINVTILDDDGTVSAVLDGTIVDTVALAPAIQEQTKAANVEIKCPGKVIVVTRKGPATCPVIIDGQSHNLEITETDPEKHNINWKIQETTGEISP